MLRISDFIFENPVIDKEKSFSSSEDIDAFFSPLKKETKELWPLNLTKHGLKTKYLSAKIIPQTWKSEALLRIQAEVFNEKHKAVIEQTFEFGEADNLIITISSVHRSDSDAYPQKMKIAHLLTVSNFNFLQSFDSYNKSKADSFIQIHASSGMTKQHILTYGGYVWANNGFDFRDKTELQIAKAAFKHFAKKHGIDLPDKSLRFFTKPCHFSAYSNGSLVFLDGKPCHIGKMFMSQHSWRGVLKTSAIDDVAYRYAEAYYGEPIPALRRKRAFFEFNRSYRSFIRKAHKKTFLKQISSKFKAFRRLLCIKKYRQKVCDLRT